MKEPTYEAHSAAAAPPAVPPAAAPRPSRCSCPAAPPVAGGGSADPCAACLGLRARAAGRLAAAGWGSLLPGPCGKKSGQTCSWSCRREWAAAAATGTSHATAQTGTFQQLGCAWCRLNPLGLVGESITCRQAGQTAAACLPGHTRWCHVAAGQPLDLSNKLVSRQAMCLQH